jgi:hypothetical protein
LLILKRITLAIIVSSALVSIASPSALAQKKRKGSEAEFTSTYNRFEDRTTVSSGWIRIDMSMVFLCGFHYPGERMDKPVDGAVIQFGSVTREWTFLRDNEAIILADGERIALGGAKHSGKVGHGDVTEMLTYSISRNDLAKIAVAHQAEIQIGHRQLAFGANHLAAMRELADRMEPTETKSAN